MGIFLFNVVNKRLKDTEKHFINIYDLIPYLDKGNAIKTTDVEGYLNIN